ncbi:hypothetical protein EV121DRAFT_253785 [Schizophyllum commune]
MNEAREVSICTGSFLDEPPRTPSLRSPSSSFPSFFPMYALAVVLLWAALCAGVRAVVTDHLPLSWTFDFLDADNNIKPIPVYEQCETMHVKWSRGSVATGPSGVAPYSFLIYTSIHTFPFVIDAGSGLNFDWEFDLNGNTGGCQAVMSVVSNTTAFPSTCSNSTLNSPKQLDVEAFDSLGGELSFTGWPAQCTDIQFVPKNGTGPYTLTIAPPLHPPYNVTLEDMSAFNWTIALGWTTPFWVSIEDSAHNSWSRGLLHSGEGDSFCLRSVPAAVSPGAAAGIGIGGLVLGAVAAALGLLHRRRSKATVLDIDPADPVPQTVERHASDSNPEHNFYLLHRDGGSAPVAVYRGVERPVMEMPPQYSSEGDPSVTQGSPRAEDSLGQAGTAIPMPQPARPRKTSRLSEKLGVVN